MICRLGGRRRRARSTFLLRGFFTYDTFSRSHSGAARLPHSELPRVARGTTTPRNASASRALLRRRVYYHSRDALLFYHLRDAHLFRRATADVSHYRRMSDGRRELPPT